MLNAGVGSWPYRRARLSPERVALIHGVDVLTFRELDDRCLRLAHVLRSLGVAPGDRVAYLGPNHPALLETLFASTSLGAVFVPLNWRLAADELRFVVADAGATVLVYDAEFAAAVTAMSAGDTPITATIAVGADLAARLADAGARGPERIDAPVAIDDPAVLIYTSGTTGRPKGSTLSHANITWNCMNVLIDTDLVTDEVALVCAPMFHVAALNMVAMPAVMKGVALVIVGKFDPDVVFDLIARHRVSVMFGVPSMYNDMTHTPGWATADLSSLKRMLCGGAPVPRATIDTYLDRGIAFLQGYGMTETSPGALFLGASRALDKAGTAGVSSFFTDVRVVRPDGTDVDPGERGEVIVSGPNVMLGYWGLPDATNDAIVDGWFHSGDVAVVDDDGYVTIVDRMKDVIISGGENVYPAEVEAVLYTHPAVAHCAVIGVADEHWGEVGRAIVVVRDGIDIDAAALLGHFEGRLARYKIPKSVVFVDTLPRSGAGKILKAELRTLHGST